MQHLRLAPSTFALALLVGAASPATAAPVAIVALDVEYQRSDLQAPKHANAIATPVKFSTSLRKGVQGSFSESKATPYVAACELRTVDGQTQEPKLERREAKSGLDFEATVQSISDRAALIDLRTAATDLMEMKTWHVDGCEIAGPEIVQFKYEGRLELPLDGKPVVLQLREGESLIMRVVKSWRHPI
jgi:hypothetical protein